MPNIKIKVDPQETNGVKVNTTATAMTVNAIGDIKEVDPYVYDSVWFGKDREGRNTYEISNITFVNALRENSNDKIIYFSSPTMMATTTAGYKGYNINEDYEVNQTSVTIRKKNTENKYFPIVIIPENGHVVSCSDDGGENWSVVNPDSFGVVKLYSKPNITHFKLSKAEA